jgi:gliding motility-associated-like protein
MRHYLVLLFTISFFLNVKAQNCGFQGPKPIYFDSIFSYDINVFDYIKDDLSGGQKIDSITLRFISPELSKLSISLISPKGDTVFLVGPVNDYVENDILGGIYRLTFIPTSASTDTFRWQNDYPGIQPTGVYFPFKNDLQGFTGKINGVWKLLVNTKGAENEISGDLNSIRDVKIHFAIIDGDNCCKANAGELKDTIINACAGNTELVTLPGPIYANVTDIPDTTLYGYGYMIYRNDTVFDISANRDLRNLPSGSYKAKGFSFIKDSISIFQSFIGKKTSSEVLAILQNPATKKDTCGALSTGEYVFNLTPFNCVKKVTWILPKGDSILFDGKFFKQEGVYKQVIPKIGACDSVTELNIKFIDFICPKGTFQVGDSTFRTEGTFLVKLKAISGCDSLVNVKLKYYGRDLKIVLPEDLTCVRNSVSIDVRGTKSDTYKTTFEWRKLDPSIGTPIVVGTNPLLTVSAAGFYQLNIMYDEEKSCTDTLLQVIENKAVPQITKGTLLPYTCKVDSVIMGGTLTSEGVEFSYFWSTLDGKLGAKKNEKFAYALSPGNYKFKVSNIINGCRDSTDITIQADTLRPVALGGGNKFLTCAINTVTIGSALSDGGSGFITRWTIIQSNNISFFSQPTRKTQTLSSPGIFKYNVENSRNGCKDSVTVTVAMDTLLPTIILPPSDTLNCVTGNATLKPSVSSLNRIRFSWKGEQGGVIGAESTLLQPTIKNAGFYRLTLLDTINSCSREMGISITENCTPKLFANKADSINCLRAIVNYTAGITNPNAVTTYNWNSFPGNNCLLNGQGTTDISVNCPGLYRLIATNTVFNSSDTLLVEIIEDKLKPTVVIAKPDTITCNQKVIKVDGSGSSSGSIFKYVWLNANGDTVTNLPYFNTIKPELYSLEITNKQNGCFATGQVNVFQDEALPVVRFFKTTYPCNQDSFAYAPQVIPINPRFTYKWSGTGIYKNADSLQVWINKPGKYFLEITDPSQNCIVIDSVQVDDQPCPPCLKLIGTPDTLTCSRRETTLQVELCRPCLNCDIRWTGPGILPGNDFRNQRVDRPGTYALRGLAANGLETLLEVIVIGDLVPPPVKDPESYTLNCLIDTVSLLAPVLRPDTNFQYKWLPPIGENIAVLDDYELLATSAGLYQVYITNKRNACINFAEVLVRVDRNKPRANAGTDKLLTCAQTQFNLDGSASANDRDRFTYFWEGKNGGRVLGGRSTLNPFITESGSYYLTVTDGVNGCSSVDSMVVLKDNNLPIVPSFNDSTLLCKKRELTYLGKLPSSTGFSGKWCELDTLGNRTNCSSDLRKVFSAGGLYRFEVQNTLTGCVNGISVLIKEDFNSPAVDYPSSDTLRCNKPIIQLKPNLFGDTLNYTFSWMANSGRSMIERTNVSPRLFREDIYRVQITEKNNGCTRTDIIFIKADLNQPSVNAGKDTLLTCLHPAIKLQGVAKPNSTSGVISYKWYSENSVIQSGALTANASVNKTGLFWLLVEDSGNFCQAVDIVQVDDGFNKPKVNLNLADGLTLSCKKDVIRLDATPSVSAYNFPLRFLWKEKVGGKISSVPDMAAVSVNKTGTYEVKVTDLVTGCESLLPLEVIGDFVKPGFKLIDTVSLSCRVKEVWMAPTAIFPSSALFKWIPPLDLKPIVNGNQLLAREVGLYKLELTRPDNGCSFTDSVLVYYDNRPIGLKVEVPQTLNCSRTQTLVTVKVPSSQAYRYLWSTPNGEIFGSPNGSSTLARKEGNYNVVVEEVSSGCTEEASVRVIYYAPVIDSVQYDVIPPGCLGGPKGELKINKIYGGTPPFSSFLSNSSSLQRLELTAAGPQILILIDSLGCKKEIPFLVPEPILPTVALGNDTVIVAGDSLILGANIPIIPGANYRWNPSLNHLNTKSPFIQVAPVNTTVYRLEVTASNGCKATDVINVRVTQDIEVFIPNVFSPNGDGVNDFFTIFASEIITEIASLRIYSRTGNLLFDGKSLVPGDEMMGWDGKHRDQYMTSGVFIYQAVVKRRDGKLFPLQGTVTLVK